MADKANLDIAGLEKRMTALEDIFQTTYDYLSRIEVELQALETWVEASINATRMKRDVLLRAMVRHRGLEPKQWTTTHLIKALLEDEYGTKLCDRRRNARRPVPQR